MSKEVFFIIPATSKGMSRWKKIEDSFLNTTLLPSITKTVDKEKIVVRFVVGVDPGDKIYNIETLCPLFSGFGYDVKVIEFTGENEIKTPGHVTKMWNILARHAVENLGAKYLYQCGDDVRFSSVGGVNACITEIDKMNGVGVVGLDGDNSRILTQCFVTDKHFKTFGFFFPEEFKNSHCDDWLNQIYRRVKKYKRIKGYRADNMGGLPPRYPNVIASDILIGLVNRDIKKLKSINCL